MPRDMAQETMEQLLERIHAINYLYFTEYKLNIGGGGHHKPFILYYGVHGLYNQQSIMDNGFVLNELPKYMLDAIPVDLTHMLPHTTTIRAHDCPSR